MIDEHAAKKAAKAAYDREYRAKNREKIAAAKKLWGQSEVKKAYDKQWAKDHPERSREIKSAWKARNPESGRDYYAANREERLAKAAAYREKNRKALAEYTATWKANNLERAREAFRRCYRNRRHDYIVRARARRSHIVLATPAWADQTRIAEIYREAGVKGLHVDHAIPLKGKLVCGLHVETNLQLLAPVENLKKGNRYAG